MLIFNGRLLIKTCDTTSIDQWSITATFSDNTGRFTARDAKVGNRVFAHGTNSNTSASGICAYKITSIVSGTTTANTLTCIIQYDEEYSTASDIFTPDIDEDAVVCDMSSDVGFALVPGDITGLPQSVLDYMNAISFKQRDERYGKKVSDLLSEHCNGNGGGGGLSNFIDGDLRVTGTVSAGKGLKLVDIGDSEIASITPDGVKVALTGVAPIFNISMSASTKASPVVSIVSAGDIDATKVFNSLAKVSSKTTVTGVTGAEDSTEISSRGDTKWEVKTSGTTANANLTATGSTSAEVLIKATATEPEGNASITLDSQNTRVTGQLSAAGIVSDGTTAAKKYLYTGNMPQESPEDNELITTAYLKNYVSKNASASVDLTDYYNKTEVNGLIEGITLATITGDENHRVVSDEQIASWTAKQDGLGFTPENSANKGLANGYASLDFQGMLSAGQVNVPKINELIDAKLTTLTLDDIEATESRQFVTPAQTSKWDAKQDVLDYTPENSANKGIANGYASLNEQGVLDDSQVNEPKILELIDSRLGSINASDIVTSLDRQFVTSEQITEWSNKQDALGFTPENSANRGQPDGYAALNAQGVLDETQVNVEKVNELFDEKLKTTTTDAITDTSEHRYVSDEQISAWNAKQDGLGYEAENTENRGRPNGYTPLDENGYVPTNLLNLSAASSVKVILDGSFNEEKPELAPAIQLVVLGTDYNRTIINADLRVVNSNKEICKIGELSTESSIQVPWTLLSRIPTIIKSISEDETIYPDMLSETGQAGTYTQVIVDNHGLVTRGDNPAIFDNLQGTKAGSFIIGYDDYKREYYTIYADIGFENNPFIRYNRLRGCWEYSNNGREVYQFGEFGAPYSDFDLGYVTEMIDEDEEHDMGSVTDSDIEEVLDFNEDLDVEDDDDDDD